MGEKNWLEIGILVALLIFFVLGLLGLMATRKSFTKAPALNVSLEDQTITDKESINITGKADSGSEVAVNDQTANVDSAGSFSFTEPLAEGDNKVTVTATKGGKTTTVDKTITRQAGEKSVQGTETGPVGETTGDQVAVENGNLNESGPAEVVWGTTGLTMIVLSLIYYFEQKKRVKSHF